MRIKADLCDVARSGQVDGIAPFQRRWRSGEDQYAVGKRNGLFQVMCDEHYGRRRSRPQLQQLVLHQCPRLNIERRERLIHQQDRRSVDQRLREGDPLPHATTQLIWVPIFKTRQPHTANPLSRPTSRLATRCASVQRPCRHVLEDVFPREDGVSLKHISDVLAAGGDGLAEDGHMTAAWRLQPGDEVEGRGFARPRGADDGAELPAGNRACQTMHSDVECPSGRAEPLGHIVELNRWPDGPSPDTHAGEKRKESFPCAPHDRLVTCAPRLS